jgi:SAM-dependent methyltransferase
MNAIYINQILNEKGEAFFDRPVTDQRIFYNKRASVYDKQNSIPARNIRRKTINDIYKRTLSKLKPGNSIAYLDFGCGTALATKEFLSAMNLQVVRGYGIDISDDMIAIAAKRIPEYKLMRGGPKLITFNNLDLITAHFHVLCHLSDEDLGLFFKNASNSLREGGVLCFEVIKRYKVGEHTFTVEDDTHNRVFVAYNSIDADGNKILDEQMQPRIGTYRIFSKNEIYSYAKQYGFTVLICELVSNQNPDPKLKVVHEYVVVLQK